MESTSSNGIATDLKEGKPKKRGDTGIRSLVGLICGTLVYYHCAYRNISIISLTADVLIVLICSFAVLGLLFRQLSISVPVDPLEWQISQETANWAVAWLANTYGAAESVLRVAASGHDRKLFIKVVITLCMLSTLGRLASGVTVAYVALWVFCVCTVVEKSPFFSNYLPIQRKEAAEEEGDG